MNDSAVPPTQLQSADPADWPVAPAWQPLVDAFFAGARGQALLAFLKARLADGAAIFPPRPLRALEPDAAPVRARGHPGAGPVPRPRAGRGPRVFGGARRAAAALAAQHLQGDAARPGHPFPAWPEPGGSLAKWAKNGVLLLNTCLTVEEGQAASHSGKGWEELTDAVIRHVAEGERPVVFMLWGSHAQSKRVWIPGDRGHLVLTANHPSPLSALRPPVPFIGCGHFGKAREFRQQHAEK